MAVYAITLSVARSAGVFFGRANVFAPESAMLKLKREEKMGGGGESKEVGHKIKDGGYNNTNINKQLPWAMILTSMLGF